MAESLKAIHQESDLAYSQPPDPDHKDYNCLFEDQLQHLVCLQQIHTCTH